MKQRQKQVNHRFTSAWITAAVFALALAAGIVSSAFSGSGLLLLFRRAADAVHRSGAQEIPLRVEAEEAPPEPVPLVVPQVDYIIGNALPGPGDFAPGGDAALLSDFDGIDWTHPGRAPVRLLLGGRVVVSTVNILDVAPPVLILYPCAAEPGEALEPEDFVRTCSDAGSVSFSFLNPPDTSAPGMQAVTVTAMDDSGNYAAMTTELYVCERVLRLEASRDPIPGGQLAAMLGPDFAGCSPVLSGDAYVPCRLGAETLTFLSPEGEREIGVQVRDTLPPEAETEDVICCAGFTYPPEHFVRRVTDGTETSMRFAEEPDWNRIGPMDVEILITDQMEHTTAVTVHSAVVVDVEGPEIRGAVDQYFYVGQAVPYFKYITALDNSARECELTVDKSAVNYRSEGSYPVTYTATDPAGNSSSVTVTFSFREPVVTEAELDALVEDIFAEILTEDMTLCRQADAAFQYVYSHIRYLSVGNGDKSDWMSIAYQSLRKGSGDCYASAVILRYMLEKLGAEAMVIRRDDTATRHFWNLVNLGTGWYHADACRAAPDYGPHFMETTEEMFAYPNGGFTWRYDASVYPEVAVEPFRPFS